MEFKEKLLQQVEHIRAVGTHCATEETTKQALILPFLDLLGFSPYNPLRVQAEYAADFPGVKANERVDYALFYQGTPVIFVEAKPYLACLSNHSAQLSRYFNATPGVRICAITNGHEWRFFTDLEKPNVMDATPFLTVDLLNLKDSDIAELSNFRYDQFQAEAVRTFAESRVYQTQFQAVIEASLKEVDAEFVRYVAMRSNPSWRITQKLLDTLAPVVKKAVAETMSKMVISSLSSPVAPAQTGVENPNSETSQTNTESVIIDPNNPKIITNKREQHVLEVVRDLLHKMVEPQELQAKDTESYYAILYQGKVNRWLIRYQDNRQRPTVLFNFNFTDAHKAELDRAMLEPATGNAIYLDVPEDLMRIPGFLLDALAFSRNDANFKRQADNT